VEEPRVRTKTICAVSIAAGLALGCFTPDDTKESVEQALEQANLSDVEVSVDADSNVIRLTGTVERVADRVRAEEVASAIVGTTGRVQNELTVAGLGTEAVP
jgi:osmotically-inducible protein OsmY